MALPFNVSFKFLVQNDFDTLDTSYYTGTFLYAFVYAEYKSSLLFSCTREPSR